MSNQIKYKGVMLAEDREIVSPGGVLYQVKELRADALESDSLQMTVVSDSGAIQNFRLNDKVEYFRDGRRVGVYYLQSVTRVGPRQYSLYALSAVSRLTVQRHVGGMYTGETVQQVVREICGDIPVLVETCYASRPVYNWLPYADAETRSARDNLADLLFAVGAWLGTDEDGTLRVEKLWDGDASAIPAGRIDSRNVQIKTVDPVSAVVVTAHQYMPIDDEVKLFSGAATEGELVVFDEPIHDLTATGFTILESGVNYAVLSVGTGELTGKSYLHSTTALTRTVTAGAAENIVPVADDYLISVVNAADVASRMVEYYKRRTTLTVDVNPRHERAGHVVRIYHPWTGEIVSACLASRETKVSGLLKSRTNALVGFAPPQPDTSEYYDTRIVLTGSGEWTAPGNVSGSMTVVVIGAGAGGWSGLPGGNSAEQTAGTETTSSSLATLRVVGVTWVKAGDGGAGGEGGDGGHVLQETIAVAPGQKFAYRCGVGGEGGAFDAAGSQQGAAGGDSVFGTVSSARGATVPGGWQDVITGEVYAGPGTSGVAGSRGHYKQRIDGVWHDYPSPTITVNGTTYTQGADGGTYSDSSGNYKTPPYGYLEWQCNGACGGGPAYGANGWSGLAAQGSIDRSWTPPHVYAYAGNGGQGATALPPDKETARYGQGGRGGNGGGGGGSPGRASAEQDTAKDMSGREDARLTAVGSRGYGGDGSAGGQGADGCIILYLRQARRSVSGWAKDSNDRWRLDQLGRRCIV